MTIIPNRVPDPDHQVKMTVRIPRWLATRMAEMARATNRSLNGAVVSACQAYAEHYQK